MKIIYDTTLRDGAQQPEISFSLQDKLSIVEWLDRIGVGFIELGWPGANEKDSQAFKDVKRMKLKCSKIVAFGMTCAKGKKPENDSQLEKLLNAGTEFITIVGKSSRYQAEKVLLATSEENLRLIEDTCRFLVSKGRTVFFDAEHFFDGCKQDAAYSLDCLKAAVAGGASRVILCDTNGGSLPWEVEAMVSLVKNEIDIPLGIHTHNDGEMAVANSLVAVRAGADQVQGTINGYGERCGNANLCSLIPALRIKMGIDFISPEKLKLLIQLARFVAETANFPLSQSQPYVGTSAFRHKAGLHVSAIAREKNSYHHIEPEIVGNCFSIAMSELGGKSNVAIKSEEFGIKLTPIQIKKVAGEIERFENMGFQLEGADASIKLIMKRAREDYASPFEILERDVRSRQAGKRKPKDSAILRIRINNSKRDISYHVADGDGPVNALDNAIRKALLPHFPFLEFTELIDYKVRVLPGKKGTAKAVRILIIFSDGKNEWATVGCSTDSITASLQALTDGIEYAILMSQNLLF